MHPPNIWSVIIIILIIIFVLIHPKIAILCSLVALFAAACYDLYENYRNFKNTNFAGLDIVILSKSPDGRTADQRNIAGHNRRAYAGATMPYYRGSIADMPARLPANPNAPCPDFDTTNDELDGDELMVNSYVSRGDADFRAIAGSMNLRTNMDKYYREEANESECKQWWGNHEI